MQHLENMINTNRLAIKSNNSDKVAIEKRIIKDKEIYIVLLSKRCLDSFNTTNVVVLNKMNIYDDMIKLHTSFYLNMDIRTEYIIDQKGYMHTISNLYIPEPEEKSSIEGSTITISSINKIITDPDMFKEMMEKSMIKASPEVLKKFDLYETKLEIIEGGKKKIKR